MSEPYRRRPAEDEAERRVLRGAMVASLATHLAFFLLAGVAFRSSATALQIPEGFTVDLVEIPEVIAHVKTPTEGVTSSRGEIRVPTHERKPRVKPIAAREPRRPDRPSRSRPDSVPAERPPVPVTEKSGAGGRLETEVPFPYSYYTEQITRRVLENWAPAFGVPDSTSTTTVFTIQRDGSVSRIATVTTSGIVPFDREAIRAVQAVERFAPLPAGFRHDELKVRFHFTYRRGY